MQQHLRALKSLGCEPDVLLITSMLELKFDAQTIFEWQQYSSESADYQTLLDFVNLHAQAYEFVITDVGKRSSKNETPMMKANPVSSFAAKTDSKSVNCITCKERHPLFLCLKLKVVTHEEKQAIFKSSNLCLNCLKPEHVIKNCRSLHKCHVCQSYLLVQPYIPLWWMYSFLHVCFRWHRIALVADVSRMYRAIDLTEEDKYLHRFV